MAKEKYRPWKFISSILRVDSQDGSDTHYEGILPDGTTRHINWKLACDITKYWELRKVTREIEAERFQRLKGK